MIARWRHSRWHCEPTVESKSPPIRGFFAAQVREAFRTYIRCMFWPYFLIRPRFGKFAGIAATVAFWLGVNYLMLTHEVEIIAFLEAHPAPDPFRLFGR